MEVTAEAYMDFLPGFVCPGKKSSNQRTRSTNAASLQNTDVSEWLGRIKLHLQVQVWEVSHSSCDFTFTTVKADMMFAVMDHL